MLTSNKSYPRDVFLKFLFIFDTSKMFYSIIKCLLKILSKYCKPLYCAIFCQRPGAYRFTRLFGSCLLGVFLGWFLCKILFFNLDFKTSTQNKIFTAVIIFLGVGFVFSTAIKCVTLLILIGFVGKSGRSYFRALSFAIIVAGELQFID